MILLFQTFKLFQHPNENVFNELRLMFEPVAL